MGKTDQLFLFQFLGKKMYNGYSRKLFLGHTKVKKVTGKSKTRFIRGKLCPIVLYYETAWSVKDSGVFAIYLNFSKSFSMVSYNIYVDSLLRYGFDNGQKLHGEVARPAELKVVDA